MYVRLTPERDAQIRKIAKDRGYPHTINSVAREIFELGFAAMLRGPSAEYSLATTGDPVDAQQRAHIVVAVERGVVVKNRHGHGRT